MYRFLLICCLVDADLSLTTAEWPDIQLRFDLGGGRYLQPQTVPRGRGNDGITSTAIKRKALVVCDG